MHHERKENSKQTVNIDIIIIIINIIITTIWTKKRLDHADVDVPIAMDWAFVPSCSFYVSARLAHKISVCFLTASCTYAYKVGVRTQIR